MMEKFNTDKGKLDANQLFDVLMWGSYKANRDYGMTHEQLISIGVGNDAMRQRYELEQRGIFEN